ncbi:MAG: DUF805 domain-containing protein [Caulobacteraceae bacterium]|nr:DUF805 domain-containing protein [Caulobacteraceae bacterium]
MNLMFQPLRKYADFQGRARRSEFWLFWLFTFVVSFVLQIVGGMMGAGGDPTAMYSSPVMIVLLLFCLAILIPSIAVAIRRLHDTDRSGWWLLIGLIPIIGALVLLVFYVLPGTVGANKFGEDPKGGEAAAVAG